jgi:hypothetical protein
MAISLPAKKAIYKRIRNSKTNVIFSFYPEEI